MEQSGPNKNKVNRIGLNKNEWTGYDHSEQNRLKETKVDRIGPKWIDLTEVDRIELMWTDRTEMDLIEPKWTKWIE